MRRAITNARRHLLLASMAVGMLGAGAAVSDAQIIKGVGACVPNVTCVGPITTPALSLLSNKTFPISITNDSPWFNPMRISVVMGDTVTWTNRSKGTHTI